MNVKNFIYFFLGLAILLAIVAIYLSLQPLRDIHKYGFGAPKEHYGIIVMAFLSGVCFFVSGMLLYGEQRKNPGL